MDEFEEILMQHRMKHFLVVNPQGSKGDELIYMGMEKKLKESNIHFDVFQYRIRSFFHEVLIAVSNRLSQSGLEVIGKNLLHVVHPVVGLMDKKVRTIDNAAADIILLRGGAYLTDIWKEYHVLESTFCAIRYKPESIIIIAPQSFFFTTVQFPTFFKRIKHVVHLFCRERYSYNLLSSMHFPENVHIHLSHDTALYLSKEDFSLNSERGSYILIAPRNDIESAVTWKIKKIPQHTKILFGDVIHVTDFGSFVNIVRNASKVYTDRLHVAILSAILGKETYLYPNSYHKNKGVYEFSLSKFRNVKFIDSYEFLDLDS